MNITTHSKDGPKVTFLAAEKRCLKKAIEIVENATGVKGEIGDSAKECHNALTKFFYHAGLLGLDELFGSHEPADHNRENSQ